MKIRRNTMEIAPWIRRPYLVEIELKPEEIREAYELQRSIYRAEDIAQNIEDRISDAGKEDYYAADWPMRVGKKFCDELQEEVEYRSNEYGDIVDDVVRRILIEELEIDPDTMEKL